MFSYLNSQHLKPKLSSLFGLFIAARNFFFSDQPLRRPALVVGAVRGPSRLACLSALLLGIKMGFRRSFLLRLLRAVVERPSVRICPFWPVSLPEAPGLVDLRFDFDWFRLGPRDCGFWSRSQWVSYLLPLLYFLLRSPSPSCL